MWTWGCGKWGEISHDAPMFLLECVFFAWAVDRGEAKGWLRSRNPSVNPEAERGWKWNVCLCPPRSRLMYVNGTRLCSPGRCACLRVLGHLFVVHVPAPSVFYFPCCLTCGWLIAFRVPTGPGAWLSSQPPWGMYLDSVCACVCACREGGRCLTPLISSTVMWHRAVSFI